MQVCMYTRGKASFGECIDIAISIICETKADFA